MKRLMAEALLRWRLNGQDQRTLLCSPGQERALLTGLLLTGGMVASPADIRRVGLEEGIWQAEADTAAEDFPDLPARLDALTPVTGTCPLSPAELLALHKSLMAGGGGSGLHGALISDGKNQAVARDIGRHNAIDKAVGLAVERKIDLSHAALCTSGRLSLEMLVKAASADIPVLVTAKHEGSLCAQYARKLGVTLLQIEKSPS